MDTLEARVIQRILHSCRSQAAVNVSDIAVGMRLLMPGHVFDEATVVKHLAFMEEQGYKPPVAVVLV